MNSNGNEAVGLERGTSLLIPLLLNICIFDKYVFLILEALVYNSLVGKLSCGQCVASLILLFVAVWDGKETSHHCCVSFCCSLTHLIWGIHNIVSCHMFSLWRSSQGFISCCSCGFDHAFSFPEEWGGYFSQKWCSGSAARPQEGPSAEHVCSERLQLCAACWQTMPRSWDLTWAVQNSCAQRWLERFREPFPSGAVVTVADSCLVKQQEILAVLCNICWDFRDL